MDGGGAVVEKDEMDGGIERRQRQRHMAASAAEFNHRELNWRGRGALKSK